MYRIISRWAVLAFAAITIAPPFVPSAGAQSASELANLASVSGTVTSSSPFQAAKVYFRNADNRIQYMVYTAGGKYQAMHMFPGNYEMRVEARGLNSPVTQIT